MKERNQRIIVKGIVQNGDKYLIIERKDKDSKADRKWEFPGGMIKFGESFEEACLREIYEETGVVCQVLGIDIKNYHSVFFVDKDDSHLFLIPIRCRFIEQHLKGKSSDEVYKQEWVTKEELLDYDLVEGTLDIFEEYKAMRGLVDEKSI